MVDPARLRDLLTRIESRVTRLESYGQRSEEEFTGDEEGTAAAKYFLLTAIEDALAVELGRARLIQTLRGHPVEHGVSGAAWLRLLEIDGEGPEWRYWQGVFAFVAHALALGEKLKERAPSDYVVASELRRLVEAHDSAFRWNRIQLPDSKQYPGEAYLGAFERTAHQLEGWMVKHV